MERNGYDEIDAEDLEEANEVILEEALYGKTKVISSKSNLSDLVKEQMDHGEISGSIFDQVWTECYNEVRI